MRAAAAGYSHAIRQPEGTWTRTHSILAGLQSQRRIVDAVVVLLVGRGRVFRVVRGDLVLDHVAGQLGRVVQRRVGLDERLQIRVQERFVGVRGHLVARVLGERRQERRQGAAAAAARATGARVIVHQVHGRGVRRRLGLQLLHVARPVPQLVVVTVVLARVDGQVLRVVTVAHAAVGRLHVDVVPALPAAARGHGVRRRSSGAQFGRRDLRTNNKRTMMDDGLCKLQPRRVCNIY